MDDGGLIVNRFVNHPNLNRVTNQPGSMARAGWFDADRTDDNGDDK